VRARSAAEVGYRSGRCNHVRELIGGPLDQLTMLRLVASPLPGRALAVVHEAKEPVRGRHDGDATRAAARRVPDAIRELVAEDQRDRTTSLADVRLLAGVTVLVSPMCRSGTQDRAMPADLASGVLCRRSARRGVRGSGILCRCQEGRSSRRRPTGTPRMTGGDSYVVSAQRARGWPFSTSARRPTSLVSMRPLVRRRTARQRNAGSEGSHGSRLPGRPAWLDPKFHEFQMPRSDWQDEVAQLRDEAEAASLELRSLATYDRP
jgi:hypothetical protein